MASEIEEEAGSGFRQFDVVADYSDHHFANGSSGNNKSNPAAAARGCFSNARSSEYKKIVQEWKILGESLPETIYVRTFEARIDLLRAVIIGAQGTPYHDGLFCFDIAFPEDYPNTPPKVYYRSFGLTVNPHIYSNGQVCLSLLNTMIGFSKCERWNPTCSSVLQILVSIQALVLSAKPLYKSYNKIAFASTCKTMHYMLRAPPRNFKEFVTAHFMKHGCDILKAIDAYKNGTASVGRYYDPGGKQKVSKVGKCFVRDLDQLYNLLFADFLRIKAPGIDKLRPPLESTSNGTTAARGGKQNQKNAKSDEGNQKSILGYLLGKIKKVFKIDHKKPSSLQTAETSVTV